MIIAAIAFLGVTYNAIFAFIYSHIGIINEGHVVLAELALSFACICIIVVNGIKKDDELIIAFGATVLISAVLIYIASSLVAMNMIRNFLIVIVFTMVGFRINKQVFHQLIYVISAIVLAVLVIEMSSVETYVGLFSPAKYYEATRGLEVQEFNDKGLFGNALAIEGRFNFGFFNSHRTSSIFLEQVSFANYLAVISIYTTVFWQELKTNRKVLYIALIVLGVTTTNSRTSSTIAVICLIFYQLSAVSPMILSFIKKTTLIMVFSTASFVAFMNDFVYSGDNFVGRTSLGMSHFFELTLLDYLGFGWNKLNFLWDSGFGYLIASSTIFSALGFIVFFHAYLKPTSRKALLLSSLVVIYISLNWVIGGNAIYSMKTAPILWMAFGLVKSEEKVTHPVESDL
ncbi:hypothetical protein HGP28_06155 [Vibrio sp. SM6]|uniref:Polysaccharide polymerase n=1 Tax=Vibrio agarilyticus TaxID=2726741 RepID=A0A7X8TPY2_9VIBR|nr:hypothetical protein [Vibrio agarilyticus]NLS12482.1 hypothetical protein [Vibrio agarilyticus]